MTRRTTATIGAALLCSALLLAAWQASRVWTPVNGPEEGSFSPPGGESAWYIAPDLRAAVLARLPAAFEPRARAARERLRSHVVPPLSDFTLRLAGETRSGGMRVVTVEGTCRHEPHVDPSPAPADATPPPAPAPVDDAPEACYLSAAYDADAGRFIYLSLNEVYADIPVAPIDCARDRFTAVTRMADLPTEIREALQAMSDLAEHDGRIQNSDIALPRPLRRRFDLAALDDERAVVGIEHTGEFHFDEVWLFERHDGHWDGDTRWRTGARVNSLQALLHGACAGVPYPPTRGLSIAERIQGYEEQDGALILYLGDEPGADYILRRRPDGAPGEILEESTNKPLPPAARAALRKHLLELRQEVLSDQPAYGFLSRYLDALVRDADRDERASAAR